MAFRQGVASGKNVKIENDKPKMWTLKAQAEVLEDCEDSEDSVSEGDASEQDLPNTQRHPHPLEKPKKENAAKEDLGEEGEAGCTIPKCLKRTRIFGDLSNTQRHPPLELPDDEHEKDTEMQGDQGGGTFENEQEPRDAPKATRNN